MMALVMGILWLVAVLAGIWLVLVFLWSSRHPEPHWDWSNIEPSVARFPEGFVWGVANAAHQVEGNCDNNNWSAWEQATDDQGRPRISEGQVAGLACDHYHRFREDIQRIVDLGCGAFRLSVEWSRIEPREGEYDDEALAHYREVLEEARKAGLKTMVTFHHFTQPLWFDEKGGFEREENIPFFVNFCERVFGEYGTLVDHWCTINEPAVYATMGWFVGIFPPGRTDARLMARVLRNLVFAHAQVYRRIHDMPGGQEASIGIVKNIFQFDPYRRWHLGDWIVARVVDRVYNRAVLDYLRTGVFSLRIPGLVNLVTEDPEVRETNDFVGLNYYSHFNVRLALSRREPFVYEQRPDDIMTDMPYAVYAEGFKRALHTISELGLPIYVTENGIADEVDDRRALFIERYLYAMHRAMEDGVDVRGYYYWTLVDNFEWAEGYDMKFGLYELDHETQERRLREGARAYPRIIREHTGPAPETGA